MLLQAHVVGRQARRMTATRVARRAAQPPPHDLTQAPKALPAPLDPAGAATAFRRTFARNLRRAFAGSVAAAPDTIRYLLFT